MFGEAHLLLSNSTISDAGVHGICARGQVWLVLSSGFVCCVSVEAVSVSGPRARALSLSLSLAHTHTHSLSRWVG